VIRHATADDRDLFLTLWREYLTELRGLGGEQLPTERTLGFYGALFDAYVSGRFEGVVLLAGDYGVLMEGAVAEGPILDTVYEPAAHSWGTYTRHTHRRRGVSRALRESMNKALREAGFRSIIAGVHIGNPVGSASTIGFGFERVQDVVVLRLEE